MSRDVSLAQEVVVPQGAALPQEAAQPPTATLPQKFAQSKTAALAAQRRRLWNKYPVIAGIIWFGFASAAAWLVLALRSHATDFRVIPVIVLVTAVVGGLATRFIGNARRSWVQLAKAAAIAAAVVFFGLLVTCAIWWWITGPTELVPDVVSLVRQMVQACLWFSFSNGLDVYPLPLLAGLHLYWLRSRVPPSPKVLGCGQTEHVAPLAAKEGAS